MYRLSQDYQLLRALLNSGNEIVCFFNGAVCVGKVIDNRRYYFSSQRFCYSDFSMDCSDSSFSGIMSQDNVGFIAPADQGLLKTIKLSGKVSEAQKKLISALSNIKEMPEGVLPHLVFVEEEDDKGAPIYNKYELVSIIPERESCILYNPRTEENEKEEFFLNAINIDWLDTVWKRYLECANIKEKDEPELYAFVWHFEHMERNVSDAEILKAWELQDNEIYSVSKYTPGEFAELVNDERYNDQKYFVRFIMAV